MDDYEYREYYIATLINSINPKLFDLTEESLNKVDQLYRDRVEQESTDLEFITRCISTFIGEADRILIGGKWYHEDDPKVRFEGLACLKDNPDKSGYWVAFSPYQLVKRQQIFLRDDQFKDYTFSPTKAIRKHQEMISEGEYPEHLIKRFPDQDLDWKKLKSMVIKQDSLFRPQHIKL